MGRSLGISGFIFGLSWLGGPGSGRAGSLLCFRRYVLVLGLSVPLGGPKVAAFFTEPQPISNWLGSTWQMESVLIARDTRSKVVNDAT
jgi:hypothetical protein